MRTPVIASMLVLLCACGNGPNALEIGNPDIVIRHVNVVDVDSGIVLADRLVAIADGKFTALIADPGAFEPAAGTRVIDGTGTYAIPGLWDMHVHVCWSDTNASLLLPTLLKHGITGVRDMGGDLRIANAFKERVASDPTQGPDIVACGPILDGDPPVFPDFTESLSGASDVEHVIDSLLADGADFIKVYSLLDGPEFQRVADHSTAKGVRFAGHLSELVSPEIAIRSGQRSVEHLNRLDDIWFTDPARSDSIVSLMVAMETWSCPTLVVYDRKARAHDPRLRDTVLDALVPGLQAEWQSWLRSRTEHYDTEHERDSLRIAFQQQLALVKRMHERGVRILAGSDLSGQAFVYPGIGLHEELELLVAAGLSTAEALRSATLGPATYFGVEATQGSITVGKQADLVILSDDPLEAIRNMRSIKAVLHRGVVCGQRLH